MSILDHIHKVIDRMKNIIYTVEDIVESREDGTVHQQTVLVDDINECVQIVV